jgi:hypothetical protein
MVVIINQPYTKMSVFSTIAKGLTRTARGAGSASSSAARALAKKPKLLAAGATASAIATYAVVNGITVGQAVKRLASKTSEEVTDVLSSAAQGVAEGAAAGVDCDPAVENCTGVGLADDLLCDLTGICIGDMATYIMIGSVIALFMIVLLIALS